jgi:hypothetical protein
LLHAEGCRRELRCEKQNGHACPVPEGVASGLAADTTASGRLREEQDEYRRETAAFPPIERFARDDEPGNFRLAVGNFR